MTTELLPCPFCGGEAGINYQIDDCDRLTHYFEAQCAVCDATGPPYIPRANAIAAWNRRASVAAPPRDPTQVADAFLTPPQKEVARAIRFAGRRIGKTVEAEAAIDEWFRVNPGGTVVRAGATGTRIERDVTLTTDASPAERVEGSTMDGSTEGRACAEGSRPGAPAPAMASTQRVESEQASGPNAHPRDRETGAGIKPGPSTPPTDEKASAMPSEEECYSIRAYVIADTMGEPRAARDIALIRAGVEWAQAQRAETAIDMKAGITSLARHARVAEPVAWQDVIAERRRQVEKEGWTPQHDDEHTRGELQIAAACLCVDGTDAQVHLEGAQIDQWGLVARHHGNWRRQLVIAGALILAEIERMDRAHPPAKREGQP